MSRHDDYIAADRGDWSGEDDYDPYLDEDGYDDYPEPSESPEEYEAAQRQAEEPPDWYLEELAEREHELHCAEAHGGGECDCPPYEPPVCRWLRRIPRWSWWHGWGCGTEGGCAVWGYPSPLAAWRAHRRFHEMPF